MSGRLAGADTQSNPGSGPEGDGSCPSTTSRSGSSTRSSCGPTTTSTSTRTRSAKSSRSPSSSASASTAPRAALVQVCDEHGYVIESAIVKLIKDQVETAAGNDGTVDQKEFELIFGNIKQAMQGKKNDREVKRMIVQVMEETGNNKVKTGWFSNWYASLKQDLGM